MTIHNLGTIKFCTYTLDTLINDVDGNLGNRCSTCNLTFWANDYKTASNLAKLLKAHHTKAKR